MTCNPSCTTVGMLSTEPSPNGLRGVVKPLKAIGVSPLSHEEDQVPPLRIPISNILGGGDYTGQISIGSQASVANVILDTGSSTLAVKPSVYNPATDADVSKTAFAQDIQYGTGGWTGPVVQTTVRMGEPGASASVTAFVALTDEQEPQNFGPADGILGLAFNALNNAYNLAHYLEFIGVSPPNTYPWPFPIKNTTAAVERFALFLTKMPQLDLEPYFTALESAAVERNMFAFYTLRSVPSMRTADPATDPLNNGYFILGGGPEQSNLYSGNFLNVNVVDDLYYNTNLLFVQVGDGAPIAVPPLPPVYAKSLVSNSIVDSGTNILLVTPHVAQAIIEALVALNPGFKPVLERALQQGYIDAARLNLEQWPPISFLLQAETGSNPVPITCQPATYWQTDSPQAGQAMFMIASAPGNIQSILGLPLLNNYYAVFDRTQDAYGAIRFAPIVSPT